MPATFGLVRMENKAKAIRIIGSARLNDPETSTVQKFRVSKVRMPW